RGKSRFSTQTRKNPEMTVPISCFWDDAKNAGSPHFPESDENWYFHPQQFIDHLNKVITPAEFNPYEGLDPLTISTGGIILKSRTQEFRSNPGFAPYNTDLSVSNGYEYKNLKYAYITCLFDIPRKFDNGNSDIHTGIDFGSWQKSVPIKSFIHGEVLECTWNGSKEKNSSGFGNMMLIKGDNGYLYLLAHLESFLITEGRIKPDDDIAMSGTTGNSSGYHLHLEIVKPFGNLSIETMYKIGADNQFTGWHSPEQRLNRFNPFDHDDKFHSYSGGKI
ncbi:MAG: M23 family metallopeptidase, partial [Bacteroidales bacterium]|nr:M23 family metallopeptidase [Bacteroidales bacterium]